MSRLFNKIFLWCCIFGMSTLHAMDDAHKAVNLEEANKELEKSDIQSEEYIDILFKRQVVLADKLKHDSSKTLTREETIIYAKTWVEIIESKGKIEMLLDLNMIKHPQVRSDANAAINDLQHIVNRLIGVID